MLKIDKLRMGKVSAWLVLLASIIWLGCSDDDKVTDSDNRPPIITAITVDPDTFVNNHISLATVTAEDPDGDDLSYSWDSRGVEIMVIPGSAENILEFTNCCQVIDIMVGYVISTVSDGRGGHARDSVQFWVTPNGG